MSESFRREIALKLNQYHHKNRLIKEEMKLSDCLRQMRDSTKHFSEEGLDDLVRHAKQLESDAELGAAVRRLFNSSAGSVLGSVSTPKKTRAVKANGKLGGRPPKKKTKDNDGAQNNDM